MNQNLEWELEDAKGFILMFLNYNIYLFILILFFRSLILFQKSLTRSQVYSLPRVLPLSSTLSASFPHIQAKVFRANKTDLI